MVSSDATSQIEEITFLMLDVLGSLWLERPAQIAASDYQAWRTLARQYTYPEPGLLGQCPTLGLLRGLAYSVRRLQGAEH
jgi:hypothetical protein